MRVPTTVGPLLEDTLTLLRAQLRKDSIELDVVIDDDLEGKLDAEATLERVREVANQAPAEAKS